VRERIGVEVGVLHFLAGARKGGPDRHAGDWTVLLSSYSGYDRQAAVQALQQLRHAEALPELLVRVNDWVPQVRLAAHAAVCSFLQAPYLSQWCRSMDAIVALARSHRADHAELLTFIRDFLCQPEHLPELVAASVTASMAVKRYVFELQWQAAQDETVRFQLLRSALTGADIVSARQALERISGVVLPAQRQSLADAACCSRFAPVRCAGLRLVLASPQRSTPNLIKLMSLDDSGAVRAMALPTLRAHGDLAEVVEKALEVLGQVTSPAKSRGVALQFLWSAQQAEARVLCKGLLLSESAHLRRIAMNALMSIASASDLGALLLQALADESPKVQRLAADRILRGACVPDEDKVMALALGHGTIGSLMRAVSILRRSSLWNCLHWLLYARQQILPDGAEKMLLLALNQWAYDASRSCVKPSAEQRIVALADWQTASDGLPEQLRQSIGFHLKSYQIL